MFNVKFLFLQAETLVDHIKFDHGYTAKSPAIVNVFVCLIFPQSDLGQLLISPFGFPQYSYGLLWLCS